MVKVVFFVGLRRSRARVGTGGVESDDREIIPHAGKPITDSPRTGSTQGIDQSRASEVGRSVSVTIQFLT